MVLQTLTLTNTTSKVLNNHQAARFDYQIACEAISGVCFVFIYVIIGHETQTRRT